jgi:hypothetical protein
MSLSKDERLKQMRQLLVRLVEEAGDRYFMEVLVEPHEDRFAGFATTTWTQLADRGFLKEEAGAYELTERGWLKGMEVSGALSLPETRDRAVALVRALKARVAARQNHYDEIVDDREVAPETGLPPGWIYNALRSNLLNVLFPHSDLTIRVDGHDGFLIPPSFGLKWIDEPL